jgi:hypothetical protein
MCARFYEIREQSWKDLCDGRPHPFRPNCCLPHAPLLCIGRSQSGLRSRIRWGLWASFGLWIHTRRLAVRSRRGHLGSGGFTTEASAGLAPWNFRFGSQADAIFQRAAALGQYRKSASPSCTRPLYCICENHKSRADRSARHSLLCPVQSGQTRGTRMRRRSPRRSPPHCGSALKPGFPWRRRKDSRRASRYRHFSPAPSPRLRALVGGVDNRMVEVDGHCSTSGFQKQPQPPNDVAGGMFRV